MRKLWKSLSIRNLARRPARSAGLIVLAVLLSFTVFVGTLVVRSLRTGLSSLNDRLGADIMVVPYEATTRSSFENILLQGSMGYFYMDSSYLDKIAKMEGVGKISTQFYLVSTSSGCCSVPVQIIGFDPETDFTISPWVKKSYGRTLNDLDIVVGNDLNAFVGDTLRFYGVDVHVAAKLEKTGTGLDTAVYTNKNTIQTLIRASLDKKLNHFQNIDPDKVISCILLNVADGYTPEEVTNEINIHVRKVEAVQTKNMISDVSGSLTGVSDVIGILAAAVWVLALGIMIAVFMLSVGERKREFAVLRAMGASRKKVSRIVMVEGMTVSVLGSLAGAITGAVLVLSFSSLIESQLGLPFLVPSFGQILLTAVVSILVSMLAGSLSSIVASYKISRMDTALILREG